jgi:Flp pilus assembly pilin Flp
MNNAEVVCLNLWRRLGSLRNDRSGQDIIEYALMAGLVATGIVTMSPAVATNFVALMSKVNVVIAVAGSY